MFLLELTEHKLLIVKHSTDVVHGFEHIVVVIFWAEAGFHCILCPFASVAVFATEVATPAVPGLRIVLGGLGEGAFLKTLLQSSCN